MATQLLEHNLLLDIAFRSFVLMALTWGAAIICRRRSAALNHRVWVLGFCSCLFVPMVMLLTPHWPLPLLPATGSLPVSTSRVVTPAGTVAGSYADNVGMQLREPAPGPTMMRQVNHLQPAKQATMVERPAPVRGQGPAWPSPATWLLIVWCAGAAVGVLRQAWHALLMRLALRRCPTIESESWLALRDAMARQLGLRKPVNLRSHVGAVSPMVAGTWAPVVLLPDDAENWSTQRKRQVLLHALAHVQRGDVLTQSIAALACALYWFNPMTWWGAMQMKRLRELACDDMVVTHTADPTDYAQTLLDVAKGYRCQERVCAVAMARTANVENRIFAILDATRRRASLSKRSARLIVIASLVVSAAVGTMQLVSRAGEKDDGRVQKKVAKVASKKKAPGDLRKMTIRVRDEQGRPLSEANVLASVW